MLEVFFAEQLLLSSPSTKVARPGRAQAGQLIPPRQGVRLA
jgi:hypothetical protein